jgi:hypothetical protein
MNGRGMKTAQGLPQGFFEPRKTQNTRTPKAYGGTGFDFSRGLGIARLIGFAMLPRFGSTPLRLFLVIEDLTSHKERCDIGSAGQRRVCRGRRQRWQPARVGYANLGPARNSVMSVTIQLDLPDALVHEAREAGLLESARLADWLADELRRKRARVELGEMLKKLHSLPGKPMTYEEIQAEIDAVRTERRQRESRR